MDHVYQYNIGTEAVSKRARSPGRVPNWVKSSGSFTYYDSLVESSDFILNLKFTNMQRIFVNS